MTSKTDPDGSPQVFVGVPVCLAAQIAADPTILPVKKKLYVTKDHTFMNRSISIGWKKIKSQF